jgi:hypothetical protein
MIFAAVLFVVEQLEHTDLTFSLLVFSFIVLSVFTFNVARGFSRPSGAYVFFYSSMTVITAVTWKAVLGEPAQTRLQDPILDLALYNASMIGILAAVLATRVVLSGKRSFSARIGADQIDLGNAALGCFIIFLLLMVINSFGGAGVEHILTAVNQVNFFAPFAVIFGTLNAIRKSGGRRTFDWISGTALLVTVVSGAMAFSKQAMFAPLVGWLMVVASTRLKLRNIHVIGIATVTVVAFFVLVPLSQLGRDLVPEQGITFSQRLALAGDLFIHPFQLHQNFVDSENRTDALSADAGVVNGYYNTSQGFIDRLSILPADDNLNTFTDKGHILGPAPLLFDFINWVPHFILPNKEKYDIGGGVYANQGNYYAHEMGKLGPDDTTTGISFSSTAEAFHLGGWAGLVLFAPPIWFALFLVSDFLCGDTRGGPWGLFLIAYFAHAANEGALGSIIGWIWLGTLGQVLIMFFCLRFAPILGMLLSGHADRRRATPGASPISFAAVAHRRG